MFERGGNNMGGMGTKSHKKFKIVVVGSERVGKTSISVRYCENTFNPNAPSTFDHTTLQKNVQVEGTYITLDIWDTAGQEKYHAMLPLYYRDADAAIVAYDITDLESFQRMKNWIQELKLNIKTQIPIVMVGNKLDLEKNREVPIDEVNQYSKETESKHFHTSAKSGDGIDELFSYLIQKLFGTKNNLKKNKGGGGGTKLKIDAKKKGGCKC